MQRTLRVVLPDDKPAYSRQTPRRRASDPQGQAWLEQLREKEVEQ